MKDTISKVESLITDPSKGLPEDIFLFISRITPMINVDLLIKNDKMQTLLTWRDDGFYPAGWHIPGGIIRYKELISQRIKAVAKNELGVEIDFKESPIAVNEIHHHSRKDRGHFISLLYECFLKSPLDKKLAYNAEKPEAGQWAWHNKCPENIISVHEIYRKYI